MTDVPRSFEELKAKLSQAESRVKSIESSLQKARANRDDLAVTVNTLIRLGYVEPDEGTATGPVAAADINENQSLVLSQVPYGEASAIAPKTVVKKLRLAGHTEITADYVRTTLWRFAKRGVLKSENGRYWSIEAPEAEEVAAPDAETSEADNGSSGPATGRGSGYPPVAPEGSIPSGSTLSVSSLLGDDPDDDDVPF